MLREFKSNKDVKCFALGSMCLRLKVEIEGLTGDEVDDYINKLNGMSVDKLCKEADFLYYLSRK